MKMNAAVLYELGKDLVVENDIEIPELKSGQVLVQNAYSGLCRSQLMEVRGLRGVDRYLPHLLGHEGSGKVVSIGENVTKVKPGDCVILGWIKGLGIDAGGVQYRKGSFTINGGPVTTLSQFSVVSENRCVKLPESLPLDIAVLFGCSLLTGAGIVLNELNINQDNTVAVFGLGGIGLSALMALKLSGCKRIFAVDIEEGKLKLAKEFGATDFINSNKEDPVQVILKRTNGIGVDCSIESAGITSSIEQAFGVVRSKTGVCVFASHPKTGDKIQLDPYDLILGKQIRGTWGGASCPDKIIPALAQIYKEGRLPLRKLLSHTYKLEEVNKALDDLDQRKIVRALIEIKPNI